MYGTVVDYNAGVLRVRLDKTLEIIIPTIARNVAIGQLIEDARVYILGDQDIGWLCIGIIGTSASVGYSMFGAAASLSPADGLTYFFGAFPSEAPTTTAQRARIYVLTNGRITRCRMFWHTYGGVAGSNESISLYIRVNDTTDYLIATVGNTNANKLFNNSAMETDVLLGDYVEFKLVCPTWATNPTLVKMGGHFMIE